MLSGYTNSERVANKYMIADSGTLENDGDLVK